MRLALEVPNLQQLAPPWRGDGAAARPQLAEPETPPPRPAIFAERVAEAAPAQHPLVEVQSLQAMVKVFSNIMKCRNFLC